MVASAQKRLNPRLWFPNSAPGGEVRNRNKHQSLEAPRRIETQKLAAGIGKAPLHAKLPDLLSCFAATKSVATPKSVVCNQSITKDVVLAPPFQHEHAQLLPSGRL